MGRSPKSTARSLTFFEKLTPLLHLECSNSTSDAIADLGEAQKIGQVFVGFQEYLYQPGA
jgi:type I restriction enzyme R subunit